MEVSEANSREGFYSRITIQEEELKLVSLAAAEIADIKQLQKAACVSHSAITIKREESPKRAAEESLEEMRENYPRQYDLVSRAVGLNRNENLIKYLIIKALSGADETEIKRKYIAYLRHNEKDLFFVNDKFLEVEIASSGDSDAISKLGELNERRTDKTRKRELIDILMGATYGHEWKEKIERYEEEISKRQREN